MYAIQYVMCMTPYMEEHMGLPSGHGRTRSWQCS